MAEKRLYWLKLKENFFSDRVIKKLRKTAGGDTYTIIYLKMLLLGLRNGGRIYYEGVEDTFYEEIALELDEDPDNVQVCMIFLERNGLLEKVSEIESFLTEMPSMTFSESASAARMRKHRAREASQCNGTASQCDEPVTQALRTCDKNVTLDIDTDTEKDIDIEIDTDREKETEKERESDKEPVSVLPVLSDLPETVNRIAHTFCEVFAVDKVNDWFLEKIQITLQAGVTQERIESMIHSAEKKHPKVPEAYIAAGLKSLRRAARRDQKCIPFKPEDKPPEQWEQEWMQEFKAIERSIEAQ